MSITEQEKVQGEGVREYLHNTPHKSVEAKRKHGKQRMAAAFRLFSKFGYTEGTAGHITFRDPEFTDHLWVNPYGISFSQIKASDLVLVNSKGEVVEGKYTVHKSAYSIHAAIHEARPDVIASVHAHSMYGKTWSLSGRLLDPLTQDACIFYNDHSVLDDYSGVVFDPNEGKKIADSLGDNKAIFLKSHGHLTVGESVDSAVFWFITMEQSCQAQLLAESAGIVRPIDEESASLTASQVGREHDGWECFQPLWEQIVSEQPDLLD